MANRERVLAIGDIHGCFNALKTLCELVPIRNADLVITLGDYVDRGPQTRDVVDWLIARDSIGKLIPLRGNHEIMMLAALQRKMPIEHWLQFGGWEVIKSYGGKVSRDARDIDKISPNHLKFLNDALLDSFETDSHIFVHAAVDPMLPMNEQPESSLFWDRFDWQAPHVSGKTIICGHTAQKQGVPRDLGHAICIDTWVYGQGFLTCLDVETGQYWQASQEGETNTDWLRP
ncbi:MAG: serine/threonine protein phosphatase [Planctomycetaceae bacterium]|nr:serine/threonine protein phosphatase [Planctomycetaceae bacterium]